MKPRKCFSVLLLWMVSLSVAAATTPVRFTAPPRYLAGATGPLAVVSGDFNNDGEPDFVVLGSIFGDVAVFLGDGGGGFTPLTTIREGTGNWPTDMAAADMNGDGKLDLVFANFGGSTAGIMLGNGDGTFRDPGLFATGASPRRVAVGDFNGDGKLDVVTANMGQQTLSVLLGDGTGGAGTAIDYPVGFTNTVAVGDVNGDGRPDLVSANDAGGDIKVLLNNGSGFTAISATYAGISPEVAALVDVNHDGKLDLVCGNYWNANISILLGNGDGTFRAAVSYTTGTFTPSFSVADFNADGHVDVLAVAGESSLITPLLGDGLGSFTVGNGYATGVAPAGVAVADFNGDGKLDAVTVENYYNTFSLYFGNGDGTLRGAMAYPVAEGSQAAAVADLNGDQMLDLVVLQPQDSTALTFFGRADGSFAAPARLDVGWSPYGIAIADVDNDGALDLVVAANAQGIRVLRGVGDGTFQSADNYDGAGPFSVAAADLDDDGFMDLVYGRWTMNDLAVLRGNAGGFSGPTAYAGATNPVGLALGDLNGDGTLDVVSGSATESRVAVWLGYGDGTFGTPQMFSAGTAPRTVAVGDIDRDGNLDVIAAANDGLWQLLGNGDGTFQPATVLLTGGYQSVTVADFNNDGIPDIAATQLTMASGVAADSVVVIFGNGDGTFVTTYSYPVDRVPSVILAADLNGDQSNDLVVVNGAGTGRNQTNVSVLLNMAGTHATLRASSLSAVYGDYVRLSATVQPSVPWAVLGGSGELATVTFSEGGTSLGSDTVSLTTDAMLTFATLTAGVHTFNARFSGNGTFNPRSFAPVTVVVAKAGSATALVVSAAKIDLGKPAVLSATVTGPGVIAGTVRFVEGSTTLGTVTVANGGKAVFSTTSLAAGPHSITAAYSGDVNHNSSSALVNFEVVAPDYSVTANPTSATIAAGQRATFTITVTPVGGFNSAINFTCSGLPALASCAFSPASLTPSSAAATAVLTVTTSGPASVVDFRRPNTSRPVYAIWLAACVPGLALLGTRRTRRWFALLAVLSVVALISCGGGAQPPPKVPTTPSGNYSVTVSGAAGSTNKTLQLTLVVQ